VTILYLRIKESRIKGSQFPLIPANSRGAPKPMDYPIKSVTVLMLASFAGGLYVAMSDTTSDTTIGPQTTGSEPTVSTTCAELRQICRQGEFPECIGRGLKPNAKSR
jgi:hypothetical protein